MWKQAMRLAGGSPKNNNMVKEKLFVGQVKDITSEILKDEIDKVHDEVVKEIAPLLEKIPAEDREKMMNDLVDIAKQVAVAAVEAYINSQIHK